MEQVTDVDITNDYLSDLKGKVEDGLLTGIAASLLKWERLTSSSSNWVARWSERCGLCMEYISCWLDCPLYKKSCSSSIAWRDMELADSGEMWLMAAEEFYTEIQKILEQCGME